MGSMRPTGRFLSFTNNIQRAQKQTVPSGFPQSLSGSETDVSTSNENLSREERYVVRHTARVEPQGQENQSSNNNNNRNSLKENIPGSNRNSLKESVGGGNSNRSSLDVSSSSYNTLIIHNQDDSWPPRPTPIREHERTSSEVKHSTTQSSPFHTLKKSEGKKSGIPLPKIHKEQAVTTTANYIDIGGQRIYTSPPDHGVQEITEIPDDFLNQSSVLKHLAKEVAQSPSPRGATPPAARAPSQDRKPKSKAAKAKLSKEKLNLSRSQPDLTRLVSVGVRAVPGGSESSGWCSGGEGSLEEPDDAFTAVLDALAAENHQLKRQLADACERVAKTNKLEEEVEKVRTAHEELVGSCERRERLERAARLRLQADTRRLHDINRALKHQVELLSQGVRTDSDSSADALRKELQNREMLIAQLITQNKELACAKERQEIEMAAQRATLQEQRTHIDILDTALTNAQSNVVRLEEECRHASGYVERVMGLQRALASLQQASDRREHTERKLRAQLEKELQTLRSDTSLYVASLQQASDRREHTERKLRAQLEKELQTLRSDTSLYVASLQQASDRREHTERKLRAQLEKELQTLRSDTSLYVASLQQASDRREHTERKLRAQLEKELQTLRLDTSLYVASLQQASDRREHTEHKLRAQLEKELQTLRSATSLYVASLQQASDRREHTERKLRAQLEKELQTLRSDTSLYVASLQQASDRREHTERKLRAQLEKELQTLRSDTSLYVASLQQASDRREHTERKLRAQLEKELQTLRKRECNCGANSTSTAGGEAELRRQLRERDERLLALEGECAKWEQRYLEEAALRQAAVSAASIPKDAKIAALEKTSAESERLMAEARNEKIRHMDELHSAQKKVADLEGRLKELESKVAERDAMIKVLQKHTSAAYDSGASLRNNSSREELVGLSSGASFSSAEGVSGGSVTGRYRHLARRNYSPHNDNSSGCGFESTSLRLDEQLAALDARLERPPVPARGLCCFPGLGGVGARGSGGRGEEALLLERQGRASQQTRSSSLPPPPSALPRPPRKPSARTTRYDRLEHRDNRKDSDGSGSIASTASRSSPLPYDTVRKLPSVPTSASLPAAESRESLVRPRDSSLPSPSKLAVYAAARRRSAESAKDNKRTHHYRIQF